MRVPHISTERAWDSQSDKYLAYHDRIVIFLHLDA